MNELVEPDQLLARAKQWLAECFKNGPRALAASLRAIREGLDLSLAEGLEREARIFADLCSQGSTNPNSFNAFVRAGSPDFCSCR